MTFAMKCRSVTDAGRNASTSPARVIQSKDLDDLRIQALAYIRHWELGGDNWPNCPILLNGKPVGYMSFNGNIWVGGKS